MAATESEEFVVQYLHQGMKGFSAIMICTSYATRLRDSEQCANRPENLGMAATESEKFVEVAMSYVVSV